MTDRKFEFELQSVLSVHESRTEQARLALQRASKKAAAQLDKVTRLRRRLEECDGQSGGALLQRVARLRRDGTYRLQLQRELIREERLLEAALRSEVDARSKLVQQRKQEETVRTLRDAAFAEHKSEQERNEQNRMDELALMATVRNRRRAS